MSFIKVNNIWKEYGETVVLEGVSTQVERGEFITIVGTSGCGKSTFLNMLLGVEQPTQGQILLEDKPLPQEPGKDRGIVFQRYSVFPHLSVLDNVLLGEEFSSSPVMSKLFGRQRREASNRATEILEAVGLGHAIDKYPDALSGGMQQRLAIVQALIKEPKILLLDEPFGALDPGIRADMHELILRLWRELKITVFMVTHDLHEGFSLGTRLWVFDKRRIDPHNPNRFGARITFDLPVGDRNAAEVPEVHPQDPDLKKIA